MAAERLVTSGCSTAIFERMPSPARKFLLAGRGGLNLTHSEPTERLLSRYGPARTALEPAIAAFSSAELTRWCEGLGVETFVGSSGRIFPKQLKTSPLLRAWLRRLDAMGAPLKLRHHWRGFTKDGALIFDTPEGETLVRADAAVFALGGASWPRLGSDGAWAGALTGAGVAVSELRPANCGFVAQWSAFFSDRFAGEPLKRAALTFEGRTTRGEAIITADGIEGGLIYALSAPLREAIARDGAATPSLDLRPDITTEALADRLSAPRGSRSLSTHVRKAAGLAPVAIALMREAGPLPTEPAALAERIKNCPLRLVAPKSLERAISTAGGVRLDEVDRNFMLKNLPGVFVAGEMLDWEAPTGGYLLQATFATAVAAAEAAAAWVRGGDHETAQRNAIAG
jgi:uncharacterized flavoprotein (TIGR03862 family)